MRAGYFALVLHAHLPYVPAGDGPIGHEERWLYEGLVESYLPLLSMLQGLARDEIKAPITLSVSPTLASMLHSRTHRARFRRYVDESRRLLNRVSEHLETAVEYHPCLAFYSQRLDEAVATFEACGENPLAAFAQLHRQERISVSTTSATHAYLPGLGAPQDVRAQLEVGASYFEFLTGVRPAMRWLPECAFEPSLEPELKRAGVALTVLDAHGVTDNRVGATYTPPIRSREGIVYFGRDVDINDRIWSRDGYPGGAEYREFYRDVGFELSELSYPDQDGFARNTMTGIKLHAVTGGEHKRPYSPASGFDRAKRDAEHFAAYVSRSVRKHQESSASPIVVAAFDAELFGHWWLEGVAFLDTVLRTLGGGTTAIPLALSGFEAVGEPKPGQPRASSWGAGGFARPWTDPTGARLWRHIHHAAAELRRQCQAARPHPLAARALDQAARELLLAQSSDWLFMAKERQMGDYAIRRAAAHVARVRGLCRIAESSSTAEFDAATARADVLATECDMPFMSELSGPRLVSHFA